MGRIFYAALLGWHLAIIALHHVGSAVVVLRDTATVSQPAAERILHVLDRFRNAYVVRHYAHYTGTAIGSGYFAPQVGSHFHVSVSILDVNGRVQRTATELRWATRTGQLRYTSFRQLFRGFVVREDAHPDGHAYEKEVAKAIGVNLAHPLLDSLSDHVVTHVRAYRPPTLAEARLGKPGALREVYRDTACFLKIIQNDHESLLFRADP